MLRERAPRSGGGGGGLGCCLWVWVDLASPKSEGLEDTMGWALVKPSLPAGPVPLWEESPSNLGAGTGLLV